MDESELKLAKLQHLLEDTRSIYNNIQWNLGGLIGIAALIGNPNMLCLQQVPRRIEVDGLNVDGFQCVSLSLLDRERSARADEILAAAKRALVCEALEITADALVRAGHILQSCSDPYEKDEFFSVNIKDLWNPNPPKAGSFLEPADRIFCRSSDLQLI